MSSVKLDIQPNKVNICDTGSKYLSPSLLCTDICSLKAIHRNKLQHTFMKFTKQMTHVYYLQLIHRPQ